MVFRNVLARFSRNLLLTAALLIPLALAFVVYVRAEKQIDYANDQRHISLQLADVLRQSSDDLTRLARTYVITGEPFYKRQYQDILDIRDGRKPLPREYWRVYWDLVLIDGQPPRPDTTRSIPLIDLMREHGFTGQELAKIAEAKSNSDRLAVLEKEAMKLAEASGPGAEAAHAKARTMMFDKRYHQAKVAIMQPIDDFYVLMAQRTEVAVHAAENRAMVLRLLFIGFSLWLMVMLWRTYRALHDTLGGSVNDVYRHISVIGQGDFSSDIVVKDGQNASIMGWLSEMQAKLNMMDRDRSRAEEAVRASEERFRALVANLAAGVVVHAADSTLLLSNSMASSLLGLSADQMTGKLATDPAWCFLREDGTALTPSEYPVNRVLVSGEVCSDLIVGIRHSAASHIVWVICNAYPVTDAGGALHQVVVTFIDISKLKQTEEALKESNSYLENLFNYANAPIIVWDSNFITTRFNRAFEQLTGRSAEHVCDRNISILFPADQVENTMKMISRALAGERWETVEISILHLDGTISTLLWNSATIYSADGVTPVATIAQGHDITTRKQAERELQNKNEELERFTYSVSHDLKSPLITIQSFAGQIQQDVTAGLYSRISGDLKRIVDASSKMTSLLNDLLELSRAGKMMGTPVQIDMERMVADVLARLAGPLSQRQVVVDLRPGLPAVFGDKQRIMTVVQNLVENAVKYMGEQPAPRIVIESWTDGASAVFCIHDNGQGIEKRFQENIFGLFNKLDAKSEGTGVGLALVKRIVEAHGGRIWVESEGEGKGSSFCFTLPAAPTETLSAGQGDRS
ncbi:MAG: PAS domain-containing sensor histidine kinase [Desulfuromonadales bacterium]